MTPLSLAHVMPQKSINYTLREMSVQGLMYTFLYFGVFPNLMDTYKCLICKTMVK